MLGLTEALHFCDSSFLSKKLWIRLLEGQNNKPPVKKKGNLIVTDKN